MFVYLYTEMLLHALHMNNTQKNIMKYKRNKGTKVVYNLAIWLFMKGNLIKNVYLIIWTRT